jgi:hypothetical protein
VLELIVNEPFVAEKSVLVKFPVVISSVQYNVPLVKFVVFTVPVNVTPSLIGSALAVIVAEGVNEVSFNVTVEDVATIVPLMLPTLTLAVKLSFPSVVKSFTAVSVKLPLPEVITKEPVKNPEVKSEAVIPVPEIL